MSVPTMTYAEWAVWPRSDELVSCPGDDTETLTHCDLKSAVYAEIDRHWKGDDLAATLAGMTWPMTVTLWARDEIDVGWWTNEALEWLAERWDEEYGDPGGGGDVAFTDEDKAAMRAAIAACATGQTVWRCSEVGYVDLRPEDVYAMWPEDRGRRR